MVRESHGKLALALRPRVAENEKNHMVKVPLILFAKSEHRGLDTPGEEGPSICILPEKTSEDIDSVFFQALDAPFNNLRVGGIFLQNVASPVGQLLSWGKLSRIFSSLAARDLVFPPLALAASRVLQMLYSNLTETG